MKSIIRMQAALSASILFTLAGCATVPDAPIVANGPASVAGTPVPLRQPVNVGPVVATPMVIREDSRCPVDAQCIHAGTVVVETRIDGAGWRETTDLSLGESYSTHGISFVLSDVLPEREAGKDLAASDYRFVYEVAP